MLFYRVVKYDFFFCLLRFLFVYYGKTKSTLGLGRLWRAVAAVGCQFACVFHGGHERQQGHQSAAVRR